MTNKHIYDIEALMKAALSDRTLVYVVILLCAISTGKLVFDSLSGLTYQIVTVFITLIIISNCVAKLFARIVLNENV